MLMKTGLCNFITQKRKWRCRVQIASWGHTDANRDSGFKPRPSAVGWGQSLCASPSTRCPSGARAILMGLMWGSGGSACETLVQSEHAQFKAWWVSPCHHQNIPNQWVWIWWLWKRRSPVFSFGYGSSWGQHPKGSTITTISGEDLEMCCWSLLQPTPNVIAQSSCCS